jgi:hypothetical protein
MTTFPASTVMRIPSPTAVCTTTRTSRGKSPKQCALTWIAAGELSPNETNRHRLHIPTATCEHAKGRSQCRVCSGPVRLRVGAAPNVAASAGPQLPPMPGARLPCRRRAGFCYTARPLERPGSTNRRAV